MPEEGTYLLTSAGFNGDKKPFVELQHDGVFTDLLPLGKTLTLHFNTTQRYCVGWRDIASGKRFSCPNDTIVEGKYEECAACQKRTGFNPAFYHANSVSEQQEVRNLEPHMLYLAHFGAGIMKVGISHAARNNSRLLEQGARSAIILDTFPSAHIARHYEARIASIDGIVETIQIRKKIMLLEQPYDQKAAYAELIQTRSAIEKHLNVSFPASQPLSFDNVYFPSITPHLKDAYDCSSNALLSGDCVGMLGQLLFCLQQETPLFLPLKKYTGYHVTLSYSDTHIDLPSRQISFF